MYLIETNFNINFSSIIWPPKHKGTASEYNQQLALIRGSQTACQSHPLMNFKKWFVTWAPVPTKPTHSYTHPVGQVFMRHLASLSKQLHGSWYGGVDSWWAGWIYILTHEQTKKNIPLLSHDGGYDSGAAEDVVLTGHLAGQFLSSLSQIDIKIYMCERNPFFFFPQ